MKTLISIIIPYHNETHGLIMRAVASINSQVGIDFDQLDVTLVGDGVAPLPLDMFANLTNIKPNIMVTTESGGAGVARQTGMDHTTGKYLMFIDADDVLRDVFAIRDLIARLSATGDHDMVVARFTHQVHQGDAFTYVESKQKDWTGVYGKLYSRAYLHRIGLRWAPDLPVYEDTYFVGMACLLTTDVDYYNRSVYAWLWNPHSTVRKNNHEFDHQLHLWARSLRYSLRMLRRRRPDLWPQEFYNYVADLFFRARNLPPADPAALREEQIRLLAENRDLWAAGGADQVLTRIKLMVASDGPYPGQSTDGADAYIAGQERLLHEAFKRSRK